MENIIGLAVLALRFLLIAFVLTAVVSAGAWFLRRELSSTQFWRMFGVSCVILLILNARACGNLY